MDGGAAFLELVFLDLKAKKFVKLNQLKAINFWPSVTIKKDVRENLQYLVESKHSSHIRLE